MSYSGATNTQVLHPAVARGHLGPSRRISIPRGPYGTVSCYKRRAEMAWLAHHPLVTYCRAAAPDA